MSGNKPPAFMFYASDFAHDQNVELMDVAEVGAYVRLMCSAWTEGSIPSDLKQIARIAKVSPARMLKLWPAIEICWQPLDGDETRLVQKRMERVRAEQQAYRDQKVIAGKAGARAKHYGKQEPPPGSGSAKVSPSANGQHKSGSAKVSPQAEEERESGTASFSLVAKPSSSYSSSLSSSYPDTNRVGERAFPALAPARTPTHARELTPTTRELGQQAPNQAVDVLGDDEIPDLPRSALESVPSPALDFARWFVAAGIKANAIDAHNALAPLEYVRKFGGIKPAADLVATYGVEECKLRAQRLFNAVTRPVSLVDYRVPNARNPGIDRLASLWSKPDIASDTPPPSRGGLRVVRQFGPGEQRIIDACAAAEAEQDREEREWAEAERAAGLIA